MTIPVVSHERRRSGRWVTGAVLAAATVVAAVAVALWWLDSDEDRPAPSPPPAPSERPAPRDDSALTPGQETAVVYYDFLRWRHMADCFIEAGYEREAYIRFEVARVPRVADYLGVVPEPRDRLLPSPGLRWTDRYGGEDPPGSQALSDAVNPENCLPHAPPIDVADAQVTQPLVDRARADDDFLATLAEYAWRAQNPGPVQLANARVLDPDGVTSANAREQSAWQAFLDAAVPGLGAGLVVTGTEVTDQYAQAAGVTELGDGAIVRVSRPEFPLPDAWQVRYERQCGEVAVSIAVVRDRGELADAGTVPDALCDVVAAASAP